MATEKNMCSIQVKEEANETGNVHLDTSQNTHSGCVYMDMNVYHEDEESSESIEIKEEPDDVCSDDLLQEGDSLPLNSIKNLANTVKSCEEKKKVKVKKKADQLGKTKKNTKICLADDIRLSGAQKENMSTEEATWMSESDEEKCPENSSPKRRYGLRSRKNVSLKEEDFHYFYSESDEEKIKPSKATSAKRILKCNKCDQIFVDKNDLAIHQEQQGNFKCLQCKKSFCSQALVDWHVCSKDKNDKKRKSKIEMTCERCGQLFNDNFRLQKHLLQHDGISLKCIRCKKFFTDQSKLDLHISQNQCKNASSFTCDICKHTFSRLNILEKHISDHMDNPRQCLNCLSFFKSVEEVNEHFRESICKSSEKNGSNICELCKKVFPQLGKLKIHLLRHEGISYKCTKCNKSFVSQESLDDHGKTVNCLLHVRRCHRCGKAYRDNVNYKKHLQTHKDNVMKCNNCKKVFIDSSKFSTHIEANSCNKPVASRKKFKYECDACGSKFVRLVKLQIHILNVHHGINFQCDKCGAKFPSQEDYNSHVQWQDCKAEDPCTCKICGKVFAKRDYLKKHQYMHTNVLFKCKYCYCAFMKEKSYKRHMDRMNCSKSARKIKLAEFNCKKCRICESEFESEEFLLHHFSIAHPNENPHQCFCCELCLPSFRDLQSHIHHHNIQKYTCNLCGKPYTSQEGFRKHRLKHKGAEFKCKFCDSEFLNESRFRFHVRTCKKNPETGYEPSQEKTKPKKKDERPKQSRQLHWESRIIMKHLRGDPNSMNSQPNPQLNQNENSIVSTFFDEPESDSKTSGERGWFDNYYKTEEDDIAFGLKKEDTSTQDYDSDFDVTEFLQSGSIVKKKKNSSSPPVTSSRTSSHSNDNYEDGDDAASSSDDSSDDSAEEEIEEAELPIDYNPKKCRLCVITFGQEYELLHHFIKLHPGKMAHKCPNCDMECPLFAQLKEHMKTHGIGMGVFNCDNCSKKFKSEKKMKSHNIRCKGMEVEIGEASSLQKITVQLKFDGEDHCKRCGKKFQTKCGYRRHKQSCKGKRKVEKEIEKPVAEVRKVKEPPQAVVKSDDEDTMNNDGVSESEEEAAEPQAKPPVSVSDTPKAEIEENPAPKETEVKDGYVGEPPLDSFPCRMCDKKFQYERGIVMHFKSDHPGHKALICHVCNMHLADKLKEHLKTHGIGEEFICELCGKRFNQKFLSKIHEMWHQGVEYKCNNCKQKFLNKEKMDKHIRENRCSNRQSLMRLPCDICGKSYRSKFGLSKHYITHTPKEQRPVKNRMNCEYCGKWFENNNGLQRHRRIHTGERPFCCRFCPKAFAQEGNCKAHERIHTGESKPRRKKPPPPVENVTYPVGQISLYIYNNIDPNSIIH